MGRLGDGDMPAAEIYRHTTPFACLFIGLKDPKRVGHIRSDSPPASSRFETCAGTMIGSFELRDSASRQRLQLCVVLCLCCCTGEGVGGNGSSSFRPRLGFEQAAGSH